KAIYGDRLSRIVLYGSHARGKARDDSDVDVMAVLKGRVDPFREIDRTVDLGINLLARYHKLVSIQPFSEDDYQRARDPLMVNVHEEGVTL
ncbi:MAG TPA: nucleotidyltransferase domain-containing protein, partial [Rhodothermales bacterium]|nr:nucleotidyltransferase domain-containing protein [Rhodothermales bacterium]